MGKEEGLNISLFIIIDLPPFSQSDITVSTQCPIIIMSFSHGCLKSPMKISLLYRPSIDKLLDPP